MARSSTTLQARHSRVRYADTLQRGPEPGELEAEEGQAGGHLRASLGLRGRTIPSRSTRLYSSAGMRFEAPNGT